MKTTDPRDPLDKKIDALLASQPIQASGDFSTRVLEELDKQPQRQPNRGVAPIIRFALPIAAALAIAFLVVSQLGDNRPETSAQFAENQAPQPDQANLTANSPKTGDELDNYDIQEILLLQEGLSGFAQIEADSLGGGDLLLTLDTLYSI